MTQATPPGWHPDPGQRSDGPPTERWWDGKAWTDRIRPAGQGAGDAPPEPPAGAAHPAPPAYPAWPAYPAGPGQPAHPGYPGYPAHPGYPGQVQPAGRRRLRAGIAVGVAAVVLASIGVGVYALSADDGSKSGVSSQRPAPEGSGGPDERGGPFGDSGGGDGGSGGRSPAPEESKAPKVDSGSVTDPVSGISLPIPDGWYGQRISVGAQVASDTTYKCPSDGSQDCMKGGAYSAPALALGAKGTTAEQVAKADIPANAEESYGKGYGKITSHDVLASRAVTVAGQKGYLVRWKAVTSKGTDGYVQSLAFPSPGNAKQLVVVRFGVDVTEGQSVLDEIAKGIKVSTGGGTGSGQDI